MTFFSIITAHYKDIDALAVTKSSLFQQEFQDFEWLIIDGASGDEFDSFSKNLDQRCFVISEPDNGIYDAYNKGLDRVNGKWVLFLGAGDRLFSDCVLKKWHSILSRSSYADKCLVYGLIRYIDKYGVINLYSIDRKRWCRGRKMVPHHQSIFHNASCISGKRFDTKFKICADAKFILGLESNFGKARFVAEDTAIYDLNGLSNNRRRIEIIYNENVKIVDESGLKDSSFSYYVDLIVTRLKIFLIKHLSIL